MLDAIREMLGLSPRYGSARAERERIGAFDGSWCSDPEDTGNARRSVVGCETNQKATGKRWL
jgi:hypothetical protein